MRYIQAQESGDPDAGAYWVAGDELAKDAYHLFKVQLDCKPSGKTIAPIPEPERCDWDTGGTCNIFGCRQERHADCSKCTGFLPCAHHCVCPPGSCARSGNCEKRPDPLT